MMEKKYRSKILKEEINELPIRSFPGTIYMIDDLEGVEKAFEILQNEKILGFDTETKPSFKKGVKHKVALLQLSTEDKAFLFRLNKIGFNGKLVYLLRSPDILKVGVSIHDDIRNLRKRRDFKPEGFLELQTFVQNYGIQDISLKKLAAIIMGIKVSKRQQVTNWEAEVLSEEQILYAATDAWIGYMLYKELISNN
jgi:ribonuclease D